MISQRSVMRWALLALLLASCERLAVKPEAPDLSYLPSDSLFAACVDTTRLRQAPLYRVLHPEGGKESGRLREVKTFLLRLGVDPDKDVDMAMFAYRGASGTEPGEWLAILRGRFDGKRIEKGLEDPGARMSAESYGRRTLYNLVMVPEIGDLSLTVVDSTALALGKANTLHRVLDIRDRSAPSLVANTEMSHLVSSLNPRAQIWAVLDGRTLSRLVKERAQMLPDQVPAPALKNLASVLTGRFAAVVSQDLKMSLEIGSSSEKNAKNLADALRGIVAFAKLGTEGRDPESAKVIEAIEVSDSGTAVRVGMDLPGDTVKRLHDKFGEAQPPAGGAAPSGH